MRALSFAVSIGGINLSSVCVKSFDMERNFSDVANKFSMTIVDDPKATKEGLSRSSVTTDTLDLEILINEGHRSVRFSYCDNNGPSQYQTFVGTIWDYDSTFVGDIKELTVTGYASKSYKGDTNGEFFYNIDWNNYYNRRKDEKDLWNGISLYAFKAQHTYQWEYEQALNNNDSNETKFLDSMVSYGNEFLSLYNDNSVMLEIQGPTGNSIYIPAPESFTAMVPHRYAVIDEETGEGQEDSDVGDVIDPDGKFWGKLTEMSLKDYILAQNGATDASNTANSIKSKILGSVDPSLLKEVADKEIVIYLDSSNKVRGFSVDGGQTGYIQMNPKKSYYGAGQLLTTATGVNISHIVKQLAILEGWEIGNIVQTELVPCSDKFKMQGQTAKQFITDVLIPLSITPVGKYKTNSTIYVDEDNMTKRYEKGKYMVVDKGQAGFTLYWKDNKVYYEPISTSLYRNYQNTKGITMGYNTPNSPVISFKVNTKGTAFFTNDNKVNSMEIATGEPINTVTTADKSSTENYNKVKGHSEALDLYYGYSYEYVKQNFGDNQTSSYGWIGLKDAKSISVNDSSMNAKVYKSSTVQKGLVNRLATSATTDLESYSTAEAVRNRIKQFTIQATMNLWGDPNISPNMTIDVTNMIKSNKTNVAEVHPTSGKYLVYKQRDTFDGSQYMQQLTMYRVDKIKLVTYDVDWSTLEAVKKSVCLADPKSVFNGDPTPSKKKDPTEGMLTYDDKGKTPSFQDAIDKKYSEWDEIYKK